MRIRKGFKDLHASALHPPRKTISMYKDRGFPARKLLKPIVFEKYAVRYVAKYAQSCYAITGVTFVPTHVIVSIVLVIGP